MCSDMSLLILFALNPSDINGLISSSELEIDSTKISNHRLYIYSSVKSNQV